MDNDELKRIYEIMLDHIGITNAIKAKEIAKKASIKISHDTAPEIRFAIKKVEETYRVAIGSCRKGYYIFVSEKDFRNWAKGEMKRMKSIERNIRRKHALMKEFQVTVGREQ